MSDPFRDDLHVLEGRASELEAENAALRAEIARVRADSVVPRNEGPAFRGPLLTLAVVLFVHGLYWAMHGSFFGYASAPVDRESLGVELRGECR